MKNRVKSICLRRGMSLSEVAEKMGIARENLNKIIGDKGNPTLETLNKLATALSVELWELFTDSVPVATDDIYGVLYVGGRPNLISSIKDLEAFTQLVKIGKS
jgi:transcriptional regulator with XRE-family HTH domain